MNKKEFTKKQLKKQLTSLTEGSLQMKDHLKTAYNAMKSLDKVSTGQKIKNEKGDNVTVTPSDNKKILAAMRKVEDLYRDIIGGEIKDKEDSEEKKKSDLTTGKNELSAGYGSMPDEVVKMSEATLKRVVERVIKEQTKSVPNSTALVVYHAQQIAQLAEKQPNGGLTEEGIGKNPEFKDSVNAIKKHINKI